MTKPFTGYHIAAILVGFFAIVIAVNVYMARMATGTFGGVLAENGYVASQDYNKWIADSTAQDRLGWSVAARVQRGHLVLDIKGVEGAAAEVVAEHPLGRVDDQAIAMTAIGASRFQSLKPMPVGRWKLRVTLSKGGQQARYLAEVRA